MLPRWFPDHFPIADPVLIFAIVLILFLVAPIAMGRFRLPGMIGLLLAGALLGPNALGLLARDASFELLGAVGLIYIMFTAALEVDLGVFRKYGLQGIVFGVFTFAIPQGLGALIAYYVLGFELLPAILLASMFASHTLLAYPIASRLGLATNRAVTATIGGTMITDTAALMVLAVIAGMAQGQVTEAFWWRLGVSLVIFVGAILVGLPRLGRWFFKRVAKDGPAEFVFVLTSVFLCAALSHAAGLEPIVGAFLAGLALNRLIPHSSTLMNRIVFTGEAIFIPFFLLSVGMLLDASVLFGGLRTWAVAGAMTVGVVVTKFLAAQITRLLFRYRSDEGHVMFGLSVVQAAATLAAVMVGRRIGLFDDAVVNGTIVMILVTCILGPYVVGRFAPSVARSEAQAVPLDAAERGGVLVPLGSGEQAEAAMEVAMLLRSKQAQIHPAFAAIDGEALAASMATADKVLAHAVSQASAADLVAQPIKRVGTDPGRALALARKELGATQIVLPWDGAPSASGARYGRIIDALAEAGEATLVLAKVPHPLGTCSRTLVFFPPGAAEARGLERAVETVERFAKQLGTSLLVIAHEPDVTLLESALSRSAEPPQRELASYPGPRAWLPLLNDRVRDGDLIVVHALREDEAARHPDARGIASRIASRFADHDVLVVFGADAKTVVTHSTLGVSPLVPEALVPEASELLPAEPSAEA